MAQSGYVTTPPRRPGPNREIVRLAVPALGALLAEPVFLLADAAIVGHLGTPQLAGVGVASVLLGTAVGLAVFLAYGTTAQVARAFGAGQLGRGLTVGVDGMYLAALLGVGVGLAGAFAGDALIGALGTEAVAAPYASRFLRWSLLGVPAMLVVLATTGVLRGLQDTRTPLAVAAAGAAANVGLNLWLVYGLDLGVAGSAIGTVVTQWAMAAALAAVVVRAARRHGASLRPRLGGIGGVGRAGVPLFVRTLTLRIALLITTVLAARQGLIALAAHQVVMTIWNFLALGLDALAIAAQAMTGRALGAGDPGEARRLTALLLRWGVLGGVGVGGCVLVVHGVAGAAFSADPAVRGAIAAALIVMAIGQPLAGYVFVLDGVLIGAGDGPYLAWAGVWNLLAFLPAAGALWLFSPGGTAGLVWLWIAFAGLYMAARAVTLGLRYRRDRWLVVT